MRTNTHANETPNPALQARLKAMIDASSLYTVTNELRIGRSQLLHYLTGLPMNTATLRGIEATLRDAGKGKGREAAR